tara:strand:+ start:558 stop:749 length:192 start_codon:yes stop_codon:yes gene_type:complete
MSSRELKARKAQSISVCGKMLRKGQTITVSESAIGDRERKMESRGRIRIIKSNKKGKVQIRAL